MKKILAFAGSTRKESVNKKLARIAAQAAKEAGAVVTLIDLADYPLPLYDGDLEEAKGLPEPAKALKKLFLEHDAFLIASPEYNSSISGVLKNAFDWVSRQETPDEPFLSAFQGKVAAIMSASPSYLGGLRGLVHLRALLNNIFVLTLPEQVTIPDAYQAFNDDGSLKSASKQKTVVELARKLALI